MSVVRILMDLTFTPLVHVPLVCALWPIAFVGVSSFCLYLLLLAASKLFKELAKPLNESYDEDTFGGNYKLTRRGNFETPPPYPNGWFCIMYSWELKVGDIKPVTFMGQAVVVFRRTDGTPAMIDAYCPHLGVNLGVRSRFVDDCIECPFHGWRFDGEGRCTRIPGQTQIPAKAHTRSWPVLERNRMILAWYSVDSPDAPTWEVPIIPEIEEGSWRWDGKSDHILRTHISDIPENTADVAHLNNLHHLPWDPWPNIIERNLKLDWNGTWKPGTAEDNDQHCAHVPVTLALHAFGRQVPFMFMTIQILLLGPGIMLYDFGTPIGSMKMWETITPMGPLLQRVSLVIFSRRNVIRWLAKQFFRAVGATLHQDCYLWNNKIYRFKPVLSKSDRYLRLFRRWYAQFYSPRSVTVDVATLEKNSSNKVLPVGSASTEAGDSLCTGMDKSLFDW